MTILDSFYGAITDAAASDLVAYLETDGVMRPSEDTRAEIERAMRSAVEKERQHGR